jgi:hypothetical protein
MSPRALTTVATVATIALSASATSPAPAAPPDPMDDPEIRAVIEGIARASGGQFSVERVVDAVRSILAEQGEADLERPRADLDTLPDLLARLTERHAAATIETPARSTTSRRTTGPKSYPRTPYEVALLARWPEALNGRRRARNSAEFSVVASHLGASESEILTMIATIHRRPL